MGAVLRKVLKSDFRTIFRFSSSNSKEMAFKFFSVYLDFFSQSVIGLNMDRITRRDVFVSTKKAGVWGFLILCLRAFK